MIFAIRNEYASAIKDFYTAIRLDPLNLKAYNNRRITYLKINRPDLAKMDMDEDKIYWVF